MCSNDLKLRKKAFVSFLILVVAAVLNFSQGGSEFRSSEAVELQVGRKVTDEIGANEKKSFSVSLTKGAYSKTTVEQNGVDLIVHVISPDERSLADVDSERTGKDAEVIEIAAGESGVYGIVVEPVILPAGRKTFSIVLDEKRIATDGEMSLQTAREQYYDALRRFEIGQYQEAIDPVTRSLDIRTGLLPEGHADVLASMSLVSTLYSMTGKIPDGITLAERERDISEKTRGANSLEYAEALYNLSRLLFFKGDIAEAKKVCLQALAIREKAAGSENRLSADTHLNLGIIYRALNDYANSEKENLRAVEIREKQFGPEHRLVAGALNNLGLMYYGLGDYTKAETVLRRALEINEKNFGSVHWEIGRVLNNIGLVKWKQHDYDGAIQTYERALAIFEKVTGPESDGVANIVANLGIIYRESGRDFTKAEEYYKRSLAITIKTKGEYSIQTAVTLSSLGILYNNTGRYAEAEPYFLRAADVYDRVAGPYHENTVKNFQALAHLYANMGNIEKALDYYKRIDAVEDRVLPVNAAVGSERQKLAYFKSIPDIDRVISLHVGLAPENRDAAALAIKKILQRKGRVIDALSASTVTLKQKLDEKGGKLVDELADVNAQLSRLVVGSRGQMTEPEFEDRIRQLEDRRETIEAEIARASSGYYETLEPITLESIRRAIPSDAALLEFAVYEPFNGKAKNQDFYGDPHYVVYVLRQDGQVKWAELGDAAALDTLISKFRVSLSDSQNSGAEKLSRAVGEKLLDKVLPLLGGATHLLIAPDGQLNLIPFEALLDDKEKYLVENYSMTYLSSGRDLLRPSGRRATGDPVIFANPAFGDAGVFADPEGRRSATKIKPRSRPSSTTVTKDIKSTYFAPISATATEGLSIKQLFPNARYMTGNQATETELKHVVSPKVLHIATHGFYLQDEEGTNAKSGLPDNPLLRSGLAFAGANSHRSEGDDGILTSLEASGLDLWGTKLVVLSACGTGLGDVRNGEGVYGLRRAFVLAGAESIVMSLWPVSDYLTREFMVGYYANLKAGLGRGESLRKVQLEMLSRPNRRHPFYWASFIQAGEWANLDDKR